MDQRIRQLWGYDFPVVDGGLSEAAVVTFVSRLIQERDTLAKGQEHLIHLRQLAEKMIIEADELAATIKQQAESESSTLLATTRSRAAEIANEAHKIITQSNVETDHILGEVQRESELLKAKITEDIARKIDENWAKLCDQGATLARRVEQELSVELNKLSESIKSGDGCSSNLTDNGHELVEQSLESSNSPDNLPTDAIENTIVISTQGEEKASDTVPVEDEALADRGQIPEISLPTDPTGEDSIDSTHSMNVLCCGDIELDIAPPLDDTKMQLLLRELRVYGIELRNIVTTSADRSTISLFLGTPMNLVAVLESVDGVTVCGRSSSNSHSQEPERLSIRLGC